MKNAEAMKDYVSPAIFPFTASSEGILCQSPAFGEAGDAGSIFDIPDFPFLF